MLPLQDLVPRISRDNPCFSYCRTEVCELSAPSCAAVGFALTGLAHDLIVDEEHLGKVVLDYPTKSPDNSFARQTSTFLVPRYFCSISRLA